MSQATDFVYKASQGYVWIQPDGPGTAYKFLNCAGLEGVTRNDGDITPLYCKDESRAGRFRVRDTIQGEPSPVTTSVMIPMGRAANYLFGLRCPFNLQLRFTTCDRPDDPGNWEKIVHLENTKVTTRSTAALAARNGGEDAEILQTLALSAQDMFEVNEVEVERQSTTENEVLTDVALDPTDECESACGPARSTCQIGYIVSNAAGKSVV